MAILKSNKARSLLRKYPFRLGRAELKRILALMIEENLEAIDIEPKLKLQLSKYHKNTRTFWWFEEIEGNLQYYIQRFLKPNGFMIDVGAATGLLGFLAARWKSCRVIMIEPSTDMTTVIEKSIRLNSEITDLCTLISKKAGLEPALTLESILEKEVWPHVDLLKIDVDGHDLDVLRSLGRYFNSSSISAIYIELPNLKTGDFNWIQSKGFKAFGSNRLHLAQLKKFHTLSEKECFTHLHEPSKFFENYLWLSKKSPMVKHFERWC